MIIITAVGTDRPGMAHALVSILSDAGCNIEDTTMTRLSGEFAMILIVTPAQGVPVEELSKRLSPLEQSHGLFINCRDIRDEEPDGDEILPRYILSVYGPEARGLVARITGVLAHNGVNITDVQTRVASAGTVYVMLFELELPSQIDADELQRALETAARQIGVQVSLHPLEEDTL
ncbi:MAG TPA: ACT domain-containing protein [Abditibacteriaceae bacterium]|jgi:glycine cleavage system transcriptional repressor